MLHVEFHVVPQMATLAHRFQVTPASATWRVTQMRRRENNFPFRPFSSMSVKFNATSRASGNFV